ncbi:uncharacterized protein BP01DRAFT_335541 [Aspergillus saccharolyticus JOP 1030-1]|uniref:Rhodopsin domain-containing protein n=1 Tax=Aspergillus saccharolyticus JOP 1030-1 TaxID=1450539 RepID=A0A318ZK23_9EURO|nr:hypothetical protein BP01DRAFT_335541 [Aspergillus saccharolyticus JOP 1030-1]PYH47899.1 hypothetical protein BP01DRAFT_335541 [Aspergillus saccharolyticus JOP 1030-1]
MYTVPIAIIFLTLTCLLVALRVFTRLRVVQKPGCDDLLIVLALLADIAFFVFLVFEIRNGLAKNQKLLSPQVVRNQLMALYITIPLYNLSLTLTKLSLVFLYKRLFPTKYYQIILAITLFFVVTTGLWMIFSAVFFCIPVHAFWDTSMPRTCLSEAVVWCLNAAFQISTDLLLVVLPMPLVIRLQIPKRQKVALIFIFALGFFVCAMSIIRLTTIIRLVKTQDFTEGNGLAATWSFIECNVAIICACLQPLRPFIIRFFPRLMPSRVRSDHPREKHSGPSGGASTVGYHGNPFGPTSTSYVTSVAGTFSLDSLSLGDAQHNHSAGTANGIQVVQELRWDSYSAEARRKSVQSGDSSTGV